MMGRKSDQDITGGLAKRLSTGKSEAPIAAPTAVAEVASPPKKPSARDGKKFVGFYTTFEQTERLRKLSYETRRQNQDLLNEALEMLFKRYDQ